MTAAVAARLLPLALALSGLGCGAGPSPRADHVAQLPGGVTMAFMRISAGRFAMGSPLTEPARDADEGPQHEVEISQPFLMGVTEVTQAQWAAIMGSRPWSGQAYVLEADDAPAVAISWDEAVAFAHRLTERLGDGSYRLPTEAQWEYACRAGTTTRWSFGDDPEAIDAYAWHTGNAWDAGQRHGHPVGAKEPNPWGLFDMHGNVNEWVQDWYRADAYEGASAVDPTGPESGTERVYRGGYFHNDGARRLRCANRMHFDPAARAASVGLRVVRVPAGG